MGKNRGAIVVDAERCKGCALCVKACPLHLLQMAPRTVNSKGYHYAEQPDYMPCTGCMACSIVCPDGCITVYRTKEE